MWDNTLNFLDNLGRWSVKIDNVLDLLLHFSPTY